MGESGQLISHINSRMRKSPGQIFCSGLFFWESHYTFVSVDVISELLLWGDTKMFMILRFEWSYINCERNLHH